MLEVMEGDPKELEQLLRDKYNGIEPSADVLAKDLARLKNGEPLAYVIGWQPFLALRVYLDSHPLIPRPETEWWTEELAGVMRKQSGPAWISDGEIPRTFSKDSHQRILDLCAGSGAIGCAILKSCPKAQVWFGELVPEHEATIRKNIQENSLDASRAHVCIGDLFAPFTGQRFDYIAANPPYIPTKRPLDASVADFEPYEALFGGEDGLALIRRIAAEAPGHMNPGGELWLECDSDHAEAARALIAAHATRTELRTDPYDRPRLIVGYYE